MFRYRSWAPFNGDGGIEIVSCNAGGLGGLAVESSEMEVVDSSLVGLPMVSNQHLPLEEGDTLRLLSTATLLIPANGRFSHHRQASCRPPKLVTPRVASHTVRRHDATLAQVKVQAALPSRDAVR